MAGGEEYISGGILEGRLGTYTKQALRTLQTSSGLLTLFTLPVFVRSQGQPHGRAPCAVTQDPVLGKGPCW